MIHVNVRPSSVINYVNVRPTSVINYVNVRPTSVINYVRPNNVRNAVNIYI